MKNALMLLLILAFALGSSGELKLVSKWETKKDLKTPESVIYDPDRDVLYVSNIGGRSTEKNGKGFISKVSLTGEIVELRWVTGLNAPKGSGIHKDKLYVADVDHLVEIDIKTGRVLAKYPAPGSEFLNDVTVDSAGNIYVSDMSEDVSAIYRFSGGEIELWLKGDGISSPNGLFAQGDILVVGNSGDGCLKAISLRDKSISTIAKVGSGIDGVAADGEGNYLISDWRGKTSLVSPSGKVTTLLDTTGEGINSADIGFIVSKRLLLVPTFRDNRIMAYRLE